MKKSKFIGLALALFSAFALTSCNSEPVVGPQGPQGETGQRGEDGVSIVSVDLTSSDGLVDIYTITYSDGTTSNFIVTNGKNGEQGIQGIPGQDGHTPVITISSDGYWVIDGFKTNTKAQGEQGEPGKDGTSLLTGNGEPAANLGKNGDSYINLDTWEFYVKTNGTWIHVGNIKGEQGNQGNDGLDGTDGINGVDGTAVLTGKGEPSDSNGKNGDSYIDLDTWNYYVKENDEWMLKGNIKGSDGADGEDGQDGIDGEDGKDGQDGIDGEDGLSAYEIYIKYHPEYTGTEEEWLEDLVNGDLREEYKVTFQTNGGSTIEPQYVKYGRLVTRPADDPTRTGYLFDGWYLGAELFPFNSYQVFDDLTLLAHWKSMNINLTLDANGGDVEYNAKTVTYGVDYVLPTPTRDNYTFDGWYLDDSLLCPMSGTWTFSKVDITLKAHWAGTEAEITFASDENIEVDNSPITLNYGDDFTLPVPTILTGDRFIGWADASGKLVTDESGKSLKPSEFKTNTELHAVYYVPVTTPNQLLNLCTAEANDERLTRTYVLHNDLDFTGLANESIYNFTGIFDGNGHDIIGLEKPLFGSVGRSDVTCTDDIEVKNVNLVNFSGESFVNQVLECDTFKIDSVTIESFVKDESNYCATYGIVRTIGNGGGINAPTNFYMNNCHINDEFTTIESGLIHYLNGIKDINITNCSVKSNTKQSAFISSDWLSPSHEIKQPDNTIKISYCSNYGDTSNLITVAACRNIVRYDQIYNQNVIVDNIANYGSISSSLFTNDVDVYNLGGIYSYTNYFKLDKVLNFGTIGSFIDVDVTCSVSPDLSKATDKIKNTFTINSCLNAGITTNASFNFTGNVTNNYQFTPLTGIEDSGAFSVTNYSQINSDFFINTIGLDPDRWNLSYINIQDEYGLPTIIY